MQSHIMKPPLLHLVGLHFVDPPHAYVQTVADPGGANPAMAPPSKLTMEFGPLWGRKSNGSIVILLKSMDFGPLVAMSSTDLALNE